MKRRRRRRANGDGDTHKRTSSTIQERLDGMPVPNHLMNLAPPGVDYEVFNEHRFPRVRMLKASRGSAQATGLVFVDDSYGLTHWAERACDAPATWMDPELFLKMALADPGIKEITENIVRGRDKKACKKLEPLLDTIFESQYLQYTLNQFATARPYLAEWIVANLADDVENQPLKTKQEFYRKA